jgi:hypothetical protein
MAKDKSQEKKEIPQGIYMLFKATGKGNIASKMKMERATIQDISSAIVWCELTKEKLLQEFKKLAKINYSEGLKEKE